MSVPSAFLVVSAFISAPARPSWESMVSSTEISVEMSIASGTLYPILRKLKADDYVTTYLVESESGPARKYYKLTDKGKRYQTDVKQEWEAFAKAVNQLTMETME